jgi:nicotinamidase-related amidase
MRPAVIIVDMLEDTYGKKRNPDREQEKIVIPVRDFLKKCRAFPLPVIFACDSFLQGDFMFSGRMKAHAIRGTRGAHVLADLEPQSTDTLLPKRRFSAFFKTDLDQTLRTWGIDSVAIGGINTNFCVLATAFDAFCHDFYTIILEDLSAAHTREIHEQFLDAYRYSAIYPSFKVTTSEEFLASLRNEKA